MRVRGGGAPLRRFSGRFCLVEGLYEVVVYFWLKVGGTLTDGFASVRRVTCGDMLRLE